MKVLMILNDPPYGTERVYNGLRLAINLLTKHEQVDLQIFLMGDAASAAKSGQVTPNGYYNLELWVLIYEGYAVLAAKTASQPVGGCDSPYPSPKDYDAVVVGAFRLRH